MISSCGNCWAIASTGSGTNAAPPPVPALEASAAFNRHSGQRPPMALAATGFPQYRQIVASFIHPVPRNWRAKVSSASQRAQQLAQFLVDFGRRGNDLPHRLAQERAEAPAQPMGVG